MSIDRTTADAWRTSSYSGSSGGNCVQVAQLAREVGVRDSKVNDSPVMTANAEAWATFLDAQR